MERFLLSKPGMDCASRIAYVIRCLGCGKTQVGGDWVHGHEPAQEPRVAHSYCPHCFRTVLDNLRGVAAHVALPVEAESP